MQYLLTAEEYKDLQDKAALSKNVPDKKELQRVCTLLADTYILPNGWYEGNAWGCMLTLEKDDPETEHYCDECPAQKVCPYPSKSWSQ